LLYIKLEIYHWSIAVWNVSEDSEERLEEHSANNHVAALRLVWIKIFDIDLAELRTLFIAVVESKSRKRNVDVVGV
jgi:hypothetical protein